MFRKLGLCAGFTHQLSIVRNAGHSKWHNIKHIKAEKDGEKTVLFMKYARMIRIAVQEGSSPDPALNSRLASVIEEARRRDMPMATINKNIEKCKSQQVQLRRHLLEAKCCSKIYIVGEYYTENLPNLKSQFNIAFRKEPKTVQANVRSMFDEFGVVQVSLPDASLKTAAEFEDKITEDAIECDAQEVDECDFETRTAAILCNGDYIDRIKSGLLKRGYVIEYSQCVFNPQNKVAITSDERKHYENFVKRVSQLEGFEKIFNNIED